MNQRKGQSLLEYSILMIIIIAAFLTMQAYIKRGFQGRWKQSVDDMGEQYDPIYVNSEIKHRIISEASTEVRAVREGGFVVTEANGIKDAKERNAGLYTYRKDKTSMSERKDGYIKIGTETP